MYLQVAPMGSHAVIERDYPAGQIRAANGSGRLRRHPHRRPTRRAVGLAGAMIILAAGLVTIGPASTVQAAPPANDDIANATPIAAIPATFSQDTTGATATTADGECVYGKSVWYRYRPTEDGRARFTTLGSTYDTVLAVFVGPRNARERVACNDDRIDLASAVAVRFEAGRRYWIAISSCCRRSSQAAGTAELHAYRPAPAGGEVTLTTAETGGVSGRLILSGTADCDTPSGIYLETVASQRVGANIARGYSDKFVPACWPGEDNEWRMRVDSRTDWAFQPGSPVAISLSSWIGDGFSSVEEQRDLTMTPTDDPNARTHR